MMKQLFTLGLLLLPITCNLLPANAQQVDENKINDRTADSIKFMKQDTTSPFARPVPGSSRKGNNPVLFLIGNSTMRTGTKGDGGNGQWGWGAFAQRWFDKDRITVENHALGGTSSRTFYNDLWADVLKGIKPGDYVLIELGHNDNGPLDTFTARNSLHGIDPDTTAVVTLHDCRNKDWNGRVDTVYSYGQYMRMFIRDVRAKGAYPIIASLTPRNSWEPDGTITRKLTTITPWGKAVAEEMQCPWIDLEGVSARRLESFGHWKTDGMFTTLDHIHTSKFGAENNAYSAALAIKESGYPLAQYLVDLTPKQVKVQRQDGKQMVWLTGDSTVKIDGAVIDGNITTTGKVGWGQMLQDELGKKYQVVNCAKAGRSTRSFMNEGRWDEVYNSIQPGDVVLMAFGHNDIGEIGRGKDRGVLPYSYDTCHVYKRAMDGINEMVYSFGWYLTRFITDVREKGGTPVIVSLTPRNEWPGPNGEKNAGNKIERRNDSYGKWYRDVVSRANEGMSKDNPQYCRFLDLHNISADSYDKLGKEKTAPYYSGDHTHTSILGARLNAKNVAKQLKKILK